jgi:hypothetical protein
MIAKLVYSHLIIKKAVKVSILIMIAAYLISWDGLNEPGNPQLVPSETYIVTQNAQYPCYPPARNVEVGDNLPAFLLEVWPSPHCSMLLSEYNEGLTSQYSLDYRGVGVDIVQLQIDDFTDYQAPPLLPRISLFLDGVIVPIDTLMTQERLVETVIIDENGEEHIINLEPNIYSWGPELATGIHDVRVRIISEAEEVYEYHWSFTIIDTIDK